jgi:hypothetical protein
LPDMEPVIVPATVRAPRLAEAEKRLVEEAVVAKKLVEVAEVEVERVMSLKMFEPLNKLLFARRVELAAVIVISCEPLNAVPLILREVWRMVAVLALPEIEPVIVAATLSAPTLAAAAKRLVEEAVVANRFVEVAAVEVLLVMLLKMCPPVHVRLAA